MVFALAIVGAAMLTALMAAILAPEAKAVNSLDLPFFELSDFSIREFLFVNEKRIKVP